MEDNNRKTFRELRLERGITNKHVSKLLGIKPVSLCHKEAGRRQFNLQEVEKLLDLYGVSISDVKY